MLNTIGTFFSEAWPFLLALLIIVIIIAAIVAVRKVIKEGGGAFHLGTIRKSTEPNREGIKVKSLALLKDADMICDVVGERVIPKKGDIGLFRAAVKSKYKVAMFLIEEDQKVVYFFCKTEAGLRRRVENLLPNDRRKNSHWPYADVSTGEKLRFPRA
jgi:hypothetical protein